MVWTTLIRLLLAVSLLALGAPHAAAEPATPTVVASGAPGAGPCTAGVAAAYHLDLRQAGFGGIAAVSPRDVWGVGAAAVTDGPQIVPLIGHFDGRIWCTVNSHNWQRGTLEAVAAVSARDVWAVGNRIEHWDGQTWAVVPSPSLGSVPPSSLPRSLAAISFSATNNVWAMSTDNDFVERWDGRHWQQVPVPAAVTASVTPSYSVPHPELENPQLEALATISVTDTWVVGKSGPNNNDPWAMHWNGRQWQEMTLPRSPAPASYSADLRLVCEAADVENLSLPAIVALGRNDVWVAGSVTPTVRSGSCPLAFHWDGTRWREVWLVTRPQDVFLLEQTYITNQTGAWLLNVMAATPSGNLWAVGNPENLALHWDGHAWHVVSAFTGPGATEGFRLTSLSASSDNDIWAAGGGGTPWNAYQWDGKTWRGVAAIPAG